MKRKWRFPVQLNDTLDPVRRALAAIPHVTIVEPNPENAPPVLMLLTVSVLGNPASLDVYIDNGEPLFIVKRDAEWGPVPVGSRELQAEFLIEWIKEKGKELSRGTTSVPGRAQVLSGAWKSASRETSQSTYHIPPQGIGEFLLLRDAIEATPEFTVSAAEMDDDCSELPAFEFELDRTAVQVALRGGDIYYQTVKNLEMGSIPVGPVALQIQFLRERACAARDALIVRRSRFHIGRSRNR